MIRGGISYRVSLRFCFNLFLQVGGQVFFNFSKAPSMFKVDLEFHHLRNNNRKKVLKKNDE